MHRLRLLREDLPGTTVVEVSQRVGSIRDADRIVVLDGGAVAGVGTHEALMASCPLYRELAESQETAAGDALGAATGRNAEPPPEAGA